MALTPEVMARVLSPTSVDLVSKIKQAYTAEGKQGAAENYPSLLSKFLKWAEAAGHAPNTLPEDAVEAFLDDYNPNTLSSKDVMRQQLKSITNKISAEFGINLNHLVFKKNEAPRPSAAEKRERKAAREAKRLGQTLTPAEMADPVLAPAADTDSDDASPYYTEEVTPMADELSIPTAAAPSFEALGPGGYPAAPAGANIVPQVMVVQAPAPEAPAGQKQQKQQNSGNNAQAALKAQQPSIHFTMAGVQFRGPYTRISRVADGLEPGVMPGAETILFVVPSQNIVKAGDPAQFLQQFVLPQLRFPATATQVTFVLEELTAKREPTGVRAEVSVGLTNSQAAMGPMGVGLPAFQQPQFAQPAAASLPAAPANDKMTELLFKRMEADIEAARRREQELQDKMARESNVQMQMMLLQMQEKAANERRAMEDRMFEERMRAAQMGQTATPFGTPFGGGMPQPALPEIYTPPAVSPADAIKPMVDQLGGITTALIQATLQRPEAAPQRDSMEVMLPFISAMNQQMMQQQQQSQQMLMGIQQANQQFIQAFLMQPPKESPIEKFLAQQLQHMEQRMEKKEQSAGEFERALTMLMKVRQAAPELLGGGGEKSSLIEMLIENSDSLLGGAAALMQSMRGGEVPPMMMPQAPQSMAGAPRQAALPPADDAQPVAKPKPVAKAQVMEVEKGAQQSDTAQPVAKATGEASEPQERFREAAQPVLAAAAAEEVDSEALAQALKGYITVIGTTSERFQQLAGQIVTMFEAAESYEDVYETAKVLHAAAGLPVRGKSVRDLAQALHISYTEVYAAFFDGKEKTIPDAAEDDAEQTAVA